MKHLKKISSFTLSEILVVLILTTIVVGIAFSVLNLVQKQMLGIKGNFQNNSELRLLEQSLWLDFNRHQNIRYSYLDNSLACVTELDSVVYLFQKDKVIKIRDTFHVSILLKDIYFNGKEIDTGNVDAIKLEALKTLEGKQIFIFKSNDATLLSGYGF